MTGAFAFLPPSSFALLVDFAVLICTNQGGSLAAKATDDAAWTLIRHYLP